MIEDPICHTHKYPDKKFYSHTSISIATFIGGPVAAGVLVRRNFINLGNEQYGKHALFIGIVSTVLLFAGIFSVPEHILEKIPNPLFPAIYTGIIYLIVEKFQGKQLKQHKEENGEFYSGWKAAGIGTVFLCIMILGIFAYAFAVPEDADFDAAKYDQGIAQFTLNEEKAMQLFALIETAEKQQITAFIIETGIPSWQSNLQILHSLDNIEGLPNQLTQQNQILKEYCQLRIDSYQLIGKAASEDTGVYDSQILEFHEEIEALLEKL